MHTVELKKKDIKRSIIFFFKNKLKEIKNFIGSRDEIYLECMTYMLFLQKIGFYPKEAAELFNEITIIHLGKSVDEINKLTDQYATNNVRTGKAQSIINPLTADEEKVIEEYHKYLFSRCIKNEDPFDKQGKIF